ncbi:CRISPR-associated helicase/endonuclease Cas3, partial [Halorhodospira halochloris]|nr:CRISPR-associated helicase/endonuclease Cas3 [Halorhodospira halochloris]
KIALPDRARMLLESVYGEDAVSPAGLEEVETDCFAGERVAAASAHFNALDLEQGYHRAAEALVWEDDQEVGTRWSDERTFSVALVQRDANAGLSPWHSECQHPWAMSTVRLREGLARRLPDLPPGFDESVQELQKRHPGLRGARFWLVDAGEEAHYDNTLGAVIPR